MCLCWFCARTPAERKQNKPKAKRLKPASLLGFVDFRRLLWEFNLPLKTVVPDPTVMGYILESTGQVSELLPSDLRKDTRPARLISSVYPPILSKIVGFGVG